MCWSLSSLGHWTFDVTPSNLFILAGEFRRQNRILRCRVRTSTQTLLLPSNILNVRESLAETLQDDS